MKQFIMKQKIKTWRLIKTGLGSAEWNMAVDEALLYNYGDNDLPIIRLYCWKSALSFGRYQKVKKNVDLKLLTQNKFPYVRRITGGGILAHGGDLSYSLILPRSTVCEKSIKECYRYLCGFLINLYTKLGLNAQFANDTNIEFKRSDICLAGNESYDIIVEGKKMGGNAQRHSKNVLFQHGSIPISFDVEQIEPFFLKNSGLKNAATLKKFGKTITHEELSKVLVESFCETFNVDTVHEPLSPNEKQKAEELFTHKYSKEEWNIHANQTDAQT